MNNLVSDIKTLQEETLKNLQNSKASNTVRAYKSDFKDFGLFCVKNGFKSFMSSHLLKRDLPHTLRMEDRNSMSQSIENHSPFVDYKFIEYIYSLDEYYFMKDGLSKYMLRNFMNNKLPKIYFTKKKVGRPGDAKILIFKHYFEKFSDYLSMSQNKNQYFDTKSILDNINSENKNQNFSKDNRFYFRVLNYLIWKNSILNGLNNRNI